MTIEESQIGGQREVIAQFKGIAARFGARRKAIVQKCAWFDTYKYNLADLFLAIQGEADPPDPGIGTEKESI